MNPIIRNTFAVIAGIVIGSAVNMGLIVAGGSLIPPPVGADVTDMESLKASMHLFEAKHFVFPFLAHALGTLAGAFAAGLIAANHKLKFGLGIGVFFLIGGIVNVIILPAPTWFAVLDLVAAYLPMAFVGAKVAEALTNQPVSQY